MDEGAKDRPPDEAFEISAWLTEPGPFDHDVANAKPLSDKFVQLNSTSHQVATEGPGVDPFATFDAESIGYFGFNEREIATDLMVVRPESSVMGIAIAIQSYARASLHSIPQDDGQRFCRRRVDCLDSSVHLPIIGNARGALGSSFRIYMIGFP